MNYNDLFKANDKLYLSLIKKRFYPRELYKNNR